MAPSDESVRSIALYFPCVRELTGAPRSALNLFLNLNPDRWRPFLVTDAPNALSEAMSRAGFDVEFLPLSPLLSVRDHQGLRLRWLSRGRAVLDLRRHQRSLAQILLRRRAALVWARNAKGVLYAAPGARAAGCRYVWDVGLEDRSAGWVYLLHGWALRQVDLVVTQAESQPLGIFGARRQRRFGHKFRSLLPGIDPTRALELAQRAERRGAGEPVILCVGTIHPRKNQRLLLRAAIPLLARHTTARLHFVGTALDTRYADELRAMALAAGLADRVEFSGWREDIPELMARASILALTSSNEGVPQVLREAMFAGLAIVSSAVGGVPDIIDDARTGLLFPEGDEARLSLALDLLLSDPERARALGEQARREAQTRFSHADWCRRYDDLLWSLVCDRPLPAVRAP